MSEPFTTAAGTEPAPDTSWAKTVDIRDYGKHTTAARSPSLSEHWSSDMPDQPHTTAAEWPRVFVDEDWLRVVPAPGAGGRSIQYRQLAAIMANDDTWQALLGLLMEATHAD